VAVDLHPFSSRVSSDRQQRELELVRENGELSPHQLHAVLDVSMETVRRDLRVLESQGLIRRSYGRIAPVESGAFETSLSMRKTINPQEKARLATAVVSKLGEAQIIYIDEGYTEELIAQRLPSDRRLAVVTPALHVATMLAAKPNLQVMILGGRVRGNTMGVVDAWAVEMLRRLNFDLAIIGANGVTLEHGMTTPDPAVAAVKAAAIERSARRIFVGAHHKFGNRTFVTFAQPSDFELIITGQELSAYWTNQLVSASLPLLRV
jgi:DeoR family transcriptional regulator, fructose operon transcriptional repressor